jgi:hypothetical protein
LVHRQVRPAARPDSHHGRGEGSHPAFYFPKRRSESVGARTDSLREKNRPAAEFSNQPSDASEASGALTEEISSGRRVFKTTVRSVRRAHQRARRRIRPAFYLSKRPSGASERSGAIIPTRGCPRRGRRSRANS